MQICVGIHREYYLGHFQDSPLLFPELSSTTFLQTDAGYCLRSWVFLHEGWSSSAKGFCEISPNILVKHTLLPYLLFRVTEIVWHFGKYSLFSWELGEIDTFLYLSNMKLYSQVSIKSRTREKQLAKTRYCYPHKTTIPFFKLCSLYGLKKQRN